MPVFDPPPEFPSIPWPYLALAVVLIAAATALAVRGAIAQAERAPGARLREGR